MSCIPCSLVNGDDSKRPRKGPFFGPPPPNNQACFLCPAPPTPSIPGFLFPPLHCPAGAVDGRAGEPPFHASESPLPLDPGRPPRCQWPKPAGDSFLVLPPGESRGFLELWQQAPQPPPDNPKSHEIGR